MLAAPAETRSRGELDLHHRRGIAEHAVAELPRLGGDAVAELLQPVAQHLVVVAAAGVAGDDGLVAVRRNPFGKIGGVIHPARDHPQRPGLQLGRARAERAVARHILHLAMPSLRQPFEQTRLRRGQIGVGDADRLEAELASPLFDALRQRRVVHASRS